MDRIRSGFDYMMKGRRYSKFFRKPGGDDGEEHIEVKMTEDGSEDVGDSPSQQSDHSNRRALLYCGLGVVMIFFLGYLMAYLIHGKQTKVAPESSGSVSEVGKPTTEVEKSEMVPEPVVPVEEPPMSWAKIADLFTQKLSAKNFAKTLNEYDVPDRSAGSDDDNRLAQRIFEEFNRLQMKPWTDRHYVQLQAPDRNRPNLVTFDGTVYKPEGYFAYSKTGQVQGKLVYGSYGRPQDLDLLTKSNVELKDTVLLLRAGSITFAEQVKNAEARGVAAVLIFPDPKDYDYRVDTELFGHVHLGSGDPYTPGFPSFNNTQFPPTESSGLPKIPVQSVTGKIAKTLLQKIGGPASVPDFRGGITDVTYSLGGTKNITVEVNNVLVNRELYNVFGVIKGYIDPDRYIVLGAQRDAWGRGYTQATVGTSVLLELARAVQQMVETDGVILRRSIVFASWSAGEYGSIGATEWLEAYMTLLDKRVVSYINLDGVVMGRGSFMASASPLLYGLIEKTLKTVDSPTGSGSLYQLMGQTDWVSRVIRPVSLDDPSYPFLTFSGIPSISFHFISPNSEVYPYYGTKLDNMDHLNFQTNQRTSDLTVLAAQFAGRMALRLAHDHLVNLDVNQYSDILTQAVRKVYVRIRKLTQSGQLKNVSPAWLATAAASFSQATRGLILDTQNTDLNDAEACRILNDRIMRVEHGLLSPYVSPLTTPFRHILLGRGSHTLSSIAETTDMDELRVQLALATWTVQGCTNGMLGNVWDLQTAA
ncbi:transferrin receptor 1b [Synchiropus splendidus]|uniref:transferrin receptor 1b n=1 Tax=Synchiropus splendidus TaxID=270530 RepID=UPI00237E129B|nr:transferrin receptor 1b [Synchiropus splendidus]